MTTPGATDLTDAGLIELGCDTARRFQC